MTLALLLSGGVGKRVGGDIPKQYIEIKGRMIITYALMKLASCGKIDRVQIVADEAYRQKILTDAKKAGVGEAFIRGFSEPGKTRQFSILNGLRDLQEEMGERDIIVIHDAARPNVSEALLQKCVEECRMYEGVIPVLPMKDTVYLSNDGLSVDRVIDRNRIYAGQAPEAFRFTRYLEANEALLPNDLLHINGTTEPAVLAGLNVCMIHGEESNYKITTKEDLERFRSLKEGDGFFDKLKRKI